MRVDRKLSRKYAEKFTDVLTKNGKNEFQYDSEQAKNTVKKKQNIYAFSVAKTASLYKDLSKNLFDENGNKRSFADFRKRVDKINKDYNEDHLKTEWNTAHAAEESADRWQNIQQNKHVLGCLVYKTMEDGKVRDEHAVLNNIKRPVDDPFWKRYFPPNGWNCRCFTLQQPCGRDTTPADKAYAAGKEAKVTPYFKTNFGATQTLLNTSHPYFKNTQGKLMELDAVKNYGMKNYNSISTISARQGKPLPAAIHSVDDFWAKMIKDKGVNKNNFAIADPDGNQVLFDSDPAGKNNPKFFKQHIINKGRSDIIHLIEDVIPNPDEAWIHAIDNDLTNPKVYSYLKFYKDKKIVVYATEEGGVIKAESIYTIDNEKTFINHRKGLLIFSSDRF